jgi:hypothetical protein
MRVVVLSNCAAHGRCDAVIEGPDLGPSKAVLYLLTARDLHQIEMRESKANIETIAPSASVVRRSSACAMAIRAFHSSLRRNSGKAIGIAYKLASRSVSGSVSSQARISEERDRT